MKIPHILLVLTDHISDVSDYVNRRKRNWTTLNYKTDIYRFDDSSIQYVINV